MAMFIKDVRPLRRRRSTTSADVRRQKKERENFEARMSKVREIPEKYFSQPSSSDPNSGNTVYSKETLMTLLLDMSDTAEKKQILQQRRQVTSTERGEIESDLGQQKVYSRESLTSLLFDMSDTPEKKELLKQLPIKSASRRKLANDKGSKEVYSKDTLKELLWNLSDTQVKKELSQRFRNNNSAVKRKLDMELDDREQSTKKKPKLAQ